VPGSGVAHREGPAQVLAVTYPSGGHRAHGVGADHLPGAPDPAMMSPVQALLVGLGLGLAAGISPGPLLVMVVASTLRGGLRHGMAVAASPLLSDLVVVSVVLLALGRFPVRWVSWLGVAGGVLVALLGVVTVRDGRGAAVPCDGGTGPEPVASALRRGWAVNLVSPHPWIAWLTALGPLTVSTWRGSPLAGVLLVAGFYVTLVGSKVAVAALVAGGRRRLTDAGYRRAVVAAGAALVVLGCVLLVEFARLLG
jgi:threonine/homoserine/homoserine lactone efflux protein